VSLVPLKIPVQPPPLIAAESAAVPHEDLVSMPWKWIYP
jgi:hypothetical protein